MTTAASNEPQAAADRTDNSVLVVDDSAMDRHLAGAIVQKMGGWLASFAGNGAEALVSLEKQRPDVVLTDMLMPEMDGLQLVQAIRSKYPLVPVILMTAHGSEDIAIQAAVARQLRSKKSLACDLVEPSTGAGGHKTGQQEAVAGGWAFRTCLSSKTTPA
jgi:CheY-like chemotaxis protein